LEELFSTLFFFLPVTSPILGREPELWSSNLVRIPFVSPPASYLGLLFVDLAAAFGFALAKLTLD